jgi:hypothetical protein
VRILFKVILYGPLEARKADLCSWNPFQSLKVLDVTVIRNLGREKLLDR